MPADPFAVLGITPDASVDDVLAARRRLAKELHPDVGGDASRMQEVNAAVDAALALVAGATAPSAPTAPAETPGSAPRRPGGTGRSRPGGDVRWRVLQDAPSFTIEALPAEAFEALAIVTAWMGEALVDDPPYLLEAHLLDPYECWCRVELVPDAGASSISLTVAVDDGTLPDVDAVRDVYVANLNQLDWSELRPAGRGASPPTP
jgi:hypothetical protein